MNRRAIIEIEWGEGGEDWAIVDGIENWFEGLLDTLDDIAPDPSVAASLADCPVEWKAAWPPVPPRKQAQNP